MDKFLEIMFSGFWQFVGCMMLIGLIFNTLITLIKTIGWCFRPKKNVDVKNMLIDIKSIATVYLSNSSSTLLTDSEKLAKQIMIKCDNMIDGL